MSPLVLTLKQAPATWLDVSVLTPDRLSGLKLREIGALPLHLGRERVAVRDMFDIRQGDPRCIQIRRAHPRLVGIGTAMTDGTIEVRGHGGHYAGRRMRGGSIRVRGNAGDWCGAAMEGGSLEIEGDAGDFLGGPLPGDIQGMSGGLIQVHGSAGVRAGERMRRGIMVIYGDAGEFAGSRMIAGTLMILGRCGHHAGRGMRRGTIILGKEPAHVLSTFHSCGILRMDFLRLLFRQMAQAGGRAQVFWHFGPEVHRYAGDSAGGGKGELLILLDKASRRTA